MGIPQKKKPYSTWVTTLLDAASVNFSHKNFKCDTYFEDNELIAKSVVAKIMTDELGGEQAIAEITKLWPQTSYGILMNNSALGNDRTRVKIQLIKNYFKFYGK